MASEGVFRVLLVDDHPVVRIGVQATLRGVPGIEVEVCGEAATPDEALEAVRQLQPDAAIVDLNLIGRDDYTLIENLIALRPALRILVYSAMEERLHARRVLQAGAHGYLMKGASPERFAAVIRSVLEGHLAFDEAAVQEAVRTPVEETPVSKLSERELTIFRHIGLGKKAKAIADDLGMSPRTLNSYRERIKAKLSLHTGAALNLAAFEFVRSKEG